MSCFMTFDEDTNNLEELCYELYSLRDALDKHFAEDTAHSKKWGAVRSTGHCAVVALIVNKIYGGELVSCTMPTGSHWFNRISDGSELHDVDLTGDQFGLNPVQVAVPDTLYKATRVRRLEEIAPETFKRATLLATRANLPFSLPELAA